MVLLVVTTINFVLQQDILFLMHLFDLILLIHHRLNFSYVANESLIAHNTIIPLYRLH